MPTNQAAAAEVELTKLRDANPFAVRHRGCAPVVVLPTRKAARAYVDAVPEPLRYRLRVGTSTRDDVLACLRQQHCPHVPR